MNDLTERLRIPVLVYDSAEQLNAERREAATEIMRLQGLLGQALNMLDEADSPYLEGSVMDNEWCLRRDTFVLMAHASAINFAPATHDPT